ncbi:copper chaperone PCu(A)C [Litoreibacter roseus]|uniref:Copper(I)-binding protein n=1 Tax=Litoreibacter roseus TaxID=2601869 RepID=A0A6N6JE37_9RHOB|nr:copper chaperone PCu(A)C [Litoreibacter roseus]GFE63472.1 hypothetical protein KIN_05460 [Litoreibacter roseus]
MFLKSLALAASVSLAALPGLAADQMIMVDDAYARASTPSAKSGAAFMQIMNMGETEDRLIAASTDAAIRAELHTHQEASNGVMRMIHVEEGFVIPAGESLSLQRGGNHVMLIGLSDPLEQGETVNITLTFENAGDVMVEVPVDLERKPQAGAHGGHGGGHGADHGTMEHKTN